jgi:hypothetical protein
VGHREAAHLRHDPTVGRGGHPHARQCAPNHHQAARAEVHTDEYSIYGRLPEWGYGHRTVNHSAGEYGRDEDGDGFHEDPGTHIEPFKKPPDWGLFNGRPKAWPGGAPSQTTSIHPRFQARFPVLFPVPVFPVPSKEGTGKNGTQIGGRVPFFPKREQNGKAGIGISKYIIEFIGYFIESINTQAVPIRSRFAKTGKTGTWM